MSVFEEISEFLGGLTPQERDRVRELAEGLVVLLGVLIDEARKRQ